MSTLYIIIGIVVLIVLWAIMAFNSFVRLVTQAKEAWADIEVQLKRRYDLIPNLVNTVKGYATHESSVFEKVTEARTAAMSAGNVSSSGSDTSAAAMAQKAGAENMLTGALKSVFAIAEAYPDLKANTNFLELQRELSDTENKIQAARRFYNGTVRDLNIKVQSFPTNALAGVFKFSKMEFFDLADNDVAQNPVEVKF